MDRARDSATPAGTAKRRLFAGLCLALAAGFAALGLWQVERRAWKLALIARIDARVHAPPAPLPPRAAWHRDLAYTRVAVTGRFLHGAETRVRAVTALGPGWWVMTPLRLSELRLAGTTLLVNRGFVPADRADPASRAAGQAAGTVTVTGLLRDDEPGGGFLQANDPAADRWFSRDVAAIARARRLGDTPPFFLDADATPNAGGWPVGGLTMVAPRNTHLVYALTWFALAGLAATGAAMLLRPRDRPA